MKTTRKQIIIINNYDEETKILIHLFSNCLDLPVSFSDSFICAYRPLYRQH